MKRCESKTGGICARDATWRQSVHAGNREAGRFLCHFLADEEQRAGLLAARPRVTSFAWARPEQDLASYFGRSHDAGALVMHMVSTVEPAGELVRRISADAEAILRQRLPAMLD